MKTVLLAALAFLVALPVAEAAPKKKYHFELNSVMVRVEGDDTVAKTAQPRVEAKLKEAWDANDQLVGELEGAPDSTNANAYRKYLAKKKIAGAYLVTVEITEAEEEIEPSDKPRTQRMTVKLAIHVLGETIPGRTMGFTGDGKATIKQEIGSKVRDSDRTFAWDDAAKRAVDDAMVSVFKQLAVPPAKQHK